MRYRLLLRTTLLFFITSSVALTLQTDDSSEGIHSEANHHHVVRKRAVGNNKPGFFRTLVSVIAEQWTDSRNTINKVGEIVNSNILPDNSPLLQSTTTIAPPDGVNVSTTMAPFRISRSDVLKIVRRNLRGLVRLFNIEYRDAIKQSDRNYAEYRKNLSREVSKFL